MALDDLRAIGLSTGQVGVYSAVLELGIASLNKIQEKTGIERRNIYDILNKLIEKGLVSYTLEKGKKTSQCPPPNKIGEEIRQKEKELKALEETLPEIMQSFNAAEAETRAEVFRGTEGIKSILDEILDCKASYWLGGNSFEGYSAMPKSWEFWFSKWMRKRAEKKSWMYDLVDHGTYLKGLQPSQTQIHKKNCYKYCELPEKLSSPMVVIIYGDKVAQVIWGKQPFAFVLESKKVRDSFMKYFNYFWKEPV